ncbi:MAG: HAD-IIA family hydrolase [Candidatus Thorarchaeota archaeon]|jgi:HAD superfamily hydrolase (TIGR01450 family)
MDLRDKALWLFDVDSTLIRDVEDPEPFQDALKLWAVLVKKGKTVAALTNTGRLSARQVHAIVSHAGFKLDLTHTFTAGAAAAAYVTSRMPGARCFVISEGGALEDFVARGLDVTNNPPVDFVAIAADRRMTYSQLNFATKMVKNGAHLICISSSKVYPGIYLGHEDVYIGERSITMAIEHATGVEAVIVAKPMPEIVIETVKALGFTAAQAVMVGDNPETDIAGGQAAGLTTVLVERPDNIISRPSITPDSTPDVRVSLLDELIEHV